ncbi:MAG TPA: hypothetical protein VJS86_13520, partial [Arthrobacter sp.]|nr:hypothetical protein [Arthrobacter sp.]
FERFERISGEGIGGIPRSGEESNPGAGPSQPSADRPRDGIGAQASGQAAAGRAHAAGRSADCSGHAGAGHTLSRTEFLYR